MTANQTPKEILDTMLGHLGFGFEIQESDTDYGVLLQIYTEEKDRLIGSNGETLEELQYLVNRVCQAQNPDAPKVYVDVEHYRTMRNDSLVQRVRKFAEMVRDTGKPFHLDPMNAYDRRLIHTAFKDDPDLMTWSPPDDARIKRITIKRRPEEEATP